MMTAKAKAQLTMFDKEDIQFPKAKVEPMTDSRWRYKIIHNVCGKEIGTVATLLAPLRAAVADFRSPQGERTTPTCLDCAESKVVGTGHIADGDFTARKYEVKA